MGNIWKYWYVAVTSGKSQVIKVTLLPNIKGTT